MEDENRNLLVFVVSESILLGYLAVQLAVGFAGSGGLFPAIGPLVRGTLLLLVVLELAVPLVVYVDIRRRTDDPDPVWVHAAMMPVINILGLVAYLEDRQRSRE